MTQVDDRSAQAAIDPVSVNVRGVLEGEISREALSGLMAGLSDTKNEFLRFGSALALEGVSDLRAQCALVETLRKDDESKLVRLACARSLCGVEDEDVISDLVRALKSTNPAIVLASATALYGTRNVPAREAMFEVMTANDGILGEACKAALTPAPANHDFADVLIVCGQGVYHDGCYFAEYPDQNVYLGHAAHVHETVENFNYSHVVASGSYSQKKMPFITEADSFKEMWKDTQSQPVLNESSIGFDRVALDSAENIIFGLIEARRMLGRIPIRRVGADAAWQFKKGRFTSMARALGILPRFYFHGYAPSCDALAGERALEGEKNWLKDVTESKDFLLLGQKAEEVRVRRWAFPLPYESRLDELTADPDVSCVVEALQSLKESSRRGDDKESREKLAEFLGAFHAVIISPRE